MSKSTGLLIAARVIEDRISALRDEYERSYPPDDKSRTKACDRAAIMEAELLLRMVRVLAAKPFRGDPTDVAKHRLPRQSEHWER